MKIPVYGLDKGKEGEIELPAQFSEPVSPDLIKRAVIALQLSRRTPYGAFPEAGKRASAKISRRRRNYKGAYGKGISRVPRKTLSRRGAQFFWQGAFAPGTVKGRRAHPPKSEKVLLKKINRKENRKAIRSALSATMVKELVSGRSHVVPAAYPFAVGDSIASIRRTRDVISALKNFGLDGELARSSKRVIRAGKGRMRGRKYDGKTGPLIVVAGRCDLFRSASNIPGVDVVSVRSLNAEWLAPGAVPGRLTLFTMGAIDKLKKEKLFA